MRKLCVIGLFLLAVLLWACRSSAPSLEQSEAAQGHISIAVQFPQRAVSKVDYYQAEAEEKEIHSLCIWVFDKDGILMEQSPLKIDPADFPEEGGVKEFIIPVDWSFVLNPTELHVYALANAESIGFDMSNPASYTMAQLDAATFGNDSFGTSALTSSVPVTGLPMSAVKHGVPTGSSPVLKVETLTLTRMVSRIRMVFCKTLTTGAEAPVVSITNITFSGKIIPKEEFLFTSGDTGIKRTDTEEDDNNYVLDPMVFAWPDGKDICDNEAPESLLYVNQDPKSYNDMLQAAIEQGHLTDLGYIYLRESDRKLKGRINYVVNGEARSREFFMGTSNDFARNHTWTLYAYFLSGRNLQIMLVVMPWDKTEQTVDFSQLAVTVTSKLTVDENTVEQAFISKDHYEDALIPGVVAHAWLQITTPVGGTLYVKPVGGTKYFNVSTDKESLQSTATINPNEDGGKIHIYISPSDTPMREEDVGTIEASIVLSFSVEVNDRQIDADSEAIDAEHRFVRTK